MTFPGTVSIAIAAALLAATASHAESVPLPESPSRGLTPGTYPEAPPPDTTPIPPDILARRDQLQIADVLDVALRNDPRTQIAWRDARAKVDALGAARGDRWPRLDVTLGATEAKTAVQGGRFTNRQTTYGPGATLDWLVADFGERAGTIEEARRDALAAVWTHGAAVQATVLTTIEAYVAYVDAKARLTAARITQDETQTGLDTAQGRRDAGLATIADVLQAKTALSQAVLDVQTISGAIASLKGALATRMGVSPDVTFEVGELPAEVPAVDFGSEVRAQIDRALASRPDLAAAREAWLSAKAHVGTTRGSWLPKLSLDGAANRNYYRPETFVSSIDTWSVGLTLRIPVFNGLRNKYEIAEAREEEQRAAAEARRVERGVIDDVWQSWTDLETATVRIATAKDLLASATQSEEVALGRYREGVGTFLDLLSAQSVLARARAQEISSRADWFVAAARLLFSTGRLTGPEALP
ncbi:MAG TPA: TolC family protein [Candidatus Polarisedimenticolaceae bacterium]|nr:TolC family protein [Candidatus Polarisedimenticolaceae bacterium]